MGEKEELKVSSEKKAWAGWKMKDGAETQPYRPSVAFEEDRKKIEKTKRDLDCIHGKIEEDCE